MFMSILTKYFQQSVCYCACNENLCNVNDPANDKTSCLFGVSKKSLQNTSTWSGYSGQYWIRYMCYVQVWCWCAHSPMAALVDFPTSHPDHSYQLPGENPKKNIAYIWWVFPLSRLTSSTFQASSSTRSSHSPRDSGSLPNISYFYKFIIHLYCILE